MEITAKVDKVVRQITKDEAGNTMDNYKYVLDEIGPDANCKITISSPGAPMELEIGDTIKIERKEHQGKLKE